MNTNFSDTELNTISLIANHLGGTIENDGNNNNYVIHIMFNDTCLSCRYRTGAKPNELFMIDRPKERYKSGRKLQHVTINCSLSKAPNLVLKAVDKMVNDFTILRDEFLKEEAELTTQREIHTCNKQLIEDTFKKVSPCNVWNSGESVDGKVNGNAVDVSIYNTRAKVVINETPAHIAQIIEFMATLE